MHNVEFWLSSKYHFVQGVDPKFPYCVTLDILLNLSVN